MKAAKFLRYAGISMIIFISGFIIKDHYSNISPVKNKGKGNYLRIGYVNLNKSKVSKKDLSKMLRYDCDIWLLAEWNGDNLEAQESFTYDYVNAFEYVDSFTYGFHVLAKKSIEAEEFDRNERPYKCDYMKVMILHDDIQIAFIHAPPPVPACNFETNQYLSDLIKHIKSLQQNTLIAGDFNTLPFQECYRKIINCGFTDSFETNLFSNNTFGFQRYLPKFLRIDYIFYRGSIQLKYAERFKINNSDHYGLIADYLIED